ncbi:pre-miRNA 5'-monophosphate methyltransferase [Trichonephila inaurata madagascariensis]|uniref:RNA methyltransferase n=1 Tax=Trichonephila inaurata madagascariensis TaxID=2747483 RepID=A0A8X6YDV9_9ARAC|nr:pre-miRNA 5'-monophosphate methyltransferase [Trichonephila inaurata madagascariensis]
MENDHCENSNNHVKEHVEPFEPGAARFGNFINYYTFNSVSKRLQAIPPDLLLQFKNSPIVCLDIGCNSGELTTGLYSHLTSELGSNINVFVLGIDLDNNLITRSKESNKYIDHIIYEKMDIMEDSSVSQLQSFLQRYSKTKFDLITCFSTTMWIHLHHGDDGLDKFLNRISKLATLLLIEPQEWNSYKSAVRRMTRLNREIFNLEKLKIRDISHHLSQFFPKECYEHFDKSLGETSWGRSMFLFRGQT